MNAQQITPVNPIGLNDPGMSQSGVGAQPMNTAANLLYQKMLLARLLGSQGQGAQAQGMPSIANGMAGMPSVANGVAGMPGAGNVRY